MDICGRFWSRCESVGGLLGDAGMVLSGPSAAFAAIWEQKQEWNWGVQFNPTRNLFIVLAL